MGSEVVGNIVGLGVGIMDGFGLGDDVGRTDGCIVGNNVGGSVAVHSTHDIVITIVSFVIAWIQYIVAICQIVCSIGGVTVHSGVVTG